MTDMHWERLRSLDIWTALILLTLFCNSPPWSKRFSFFSEPKSDDNQFYEGEFLNILFKKLKCILDQVGSGYSREYNLSRCVMCFVLYGAFWSVWCVLVCMVSCSVWCVMVCMVCFGLYGVLLCMVFWSLWCVLVCMVFWSVWVCLALYCVLVFMVCFGLYSAFWSVWCVLGLYCVFWSVWCVLVCMVWFGLYGVFWSVWCVLGWYGRCLLGENWQMLRENTK